MVWFEPAFTASYTIFSEKDKCSISKPLEHSGLIVYLEKNPMTFTDQTFVTSDS